jgi:hypothetical protein
MLDIAVLISTEAEFELKVIRVVSPTLLLKVET